jgi:hypothetical protein
VRKRVHYWNPLERIIVDIIESEFTSCKLVQRLLPELRDMILHRIFDSALDLFEKVFFGATSGLISGSGHPNGFHASVCGCLRPDLLHSE